MAKPVISPEIKKMLAHTILANAEPVEYGDADLLVISTNKLIELVKAIAPEVSVTPTLPDEETHISLADLGMPPRFAPNSEFGKPNEPRKLHLDVAVAFRVQELQTAGGFTSEEISEAERNGTFCYAKTYSGAAR